MNIKEAKRQIKDAMTAYFACDERGHALIAPARQRPVFLLGAPGIGKTAIMQQIAEEMGVGLVSYSMTHHTRQSALGLPFITKKVYGGVEYDVSEYTMSEIIASVYDAMEATGHTRGILFLDEINCVSETLTPAMLQFLQFKTFGRHRVPDGWIVACAGNPPEYNRSVREFDIVTWDRLKRIDVEPDYSVWKEYAYNAHVHPSIITYLDLKKDDFYKVVTTVDGKRFVTARGWEDLSQMIRVYERCGLEVREELVIQYLQDKKVAKDFALYYDLFKKYRESYQVDKILDGSYDEQVCEVAAAAPFDERLSMLGLLLDAINGSMRATMMKSDFTHRVMGLLKEEKAHMLLGSAETLASLELLRDRMQKADIASRVNGAGSQEGQCVQEDVIAYFDDCIATVRKCADDSAGFSLVKDAFDQEVEALMRLKDETGSKLDNMIDFIEKVFGNGQEMLIAITELSVSAWAMMYVGEFGSEAYFKQSKALMFHERHRELSAEIEALRKEQGM